MKTKSPRPTYTITKSLLIAGSLFFLFEAILHFFGLSTLEHDKIFIATHDRYIALYAVTYFALLILIGTDLKKYKTLFILTMAGIALGMGVAALIAAEGGYSALYPVITLDRQLEILGIGFFAWYLAAWIAWIYKK